MPNDAQEAVYDMVFAGNYLIQYGSVFNWSQDETTKRFALKELLDLSDRIAKAASIIRSDLEKGSAI
jgi:hypothetical protein